MVFIENIYAIVMHKVFLEVILTFLVCQAIKLFTKSYEHKRLYLKGLVENGGMPSSHTTGVVALATSIGLFDGFTSTTFFIASVFAIIVMRDAFGIRHNVDVLTSKINSMIKKEHVRISQADLISGHTIQQLFGGLVLGVVGVLVLHFWLL